LIHQGPRVSRARITFNARYTEIISLFRVIADDPPVRNGKFREVERINYLPIFTNCSHLDFAIDDRTAHQLTDEA